jgi:hypothetical protein
MQVHGGFSDDAEWIIVRPDAKESSWALKKRLL